MITYIIIAIIVGWISGITVNYLADVLPLRRRLVKPFCIQCDSPQAWRNYIFWPRRCPECKTPRNYRVWIVEAFYITASLLMMLNPPYRIGYILGMVVLVYFGVVVLIDMEYRLIMHPVSILGAGLGLIVGIIRFGWERTLIGGVVGFGTMWLLYLLGVLIIKLISRARGQPVNDVALGFGDVNLSGVLGLMLGWPLILVGLVSAVIVGGVVSLIYMIIKIISREYQAFMALPYGPFLIFGAALVLYFSNFMLRILGN